MSEYKSPRELAQEIFDVTWMHSSTDKIRSKMAELIARNNLALLDRIEAMAKLEPPGANVGACYGIVIREIRNELKKDCTNG